MGYYSWENQREDCGHCGQRLTGMQEHYCSARCRQAEYRAGKKGRAKLAPCPLCGEGFVVTNSRKKYCDYFDEAETDCQTAQDDLEEGAWLAAEERKTAECAHCGEPAGWSGRGRPKRFCTPRCKQADYRKRRTQTTA